MSSVTCKLEDFKLTWTLILIFFYYLHLRCQIMSKMSHTVMYNTNVKMCKISDHLVFKKSSMSSETLFLIFSVKYLRNVSKHTFVLMSGRIKLRY